MYIVCMYMYMYSILSIVVIAMPLVGPYLVNRVFLFLFLFLF